MDFPWDNSDIVNYEREKKNYKIYDNMAASGNRAVVFFSGNGLYFSNTPETFQKEIVKIDRYEYEKISHSNRELKSSS